MDREPTPGMLCRLTADVSGATALREPDLLPTTWGPVVRRDTIVIVVEARSSQTERFTLCTVSGAGVLWLRTELLKEVKVSDRDKALDPRPRDLRRKQP